MKYVWKKKEKAVSPVIATILMVAITVVLAAVLVVYMRNYGKNPGTVGTDPVSKAINKKGKNWEIRITGADKPYAWSTVDVYIKSEADVQLIKQAANVLTPVTGQRTVVSHTNTNPKWYAINGTDEAKDANGADITSNYDMANNALMLSICQFVIIDNDGDGNITADDVFIVYGENDGDAALDVVAGCKVEIKQQDTVLMEAVLLS